MKVTQEKEAARQTVLEIELDDQDLEPYLDRAYRRVVNKVAVPGFRKGKAPRGVIEGRFGRGFLIEDILDRMLTEVADRAITESRLEPVARPRLTILDMDPVRFTATVALEPHVVLGDYASLSVERPRTEVTDEAVEEWIESLRQAMGTWEPVERTVAREGDLVMAEVEIAVRGRPDVRHEDVSIELRPGADYRHPGLVENVTGASKGETRRFALTIPEEDAGPGDETASGREADFAVTVREIKERRVMALDDEFVRTAYPECDDLAGMRAEVRRSLSERARERDDEVLRDAAVRALVEATDITIPDLLVDMESRPFAAQYIRDLERLGMSLEAYLERTGDTVQEFSTQMTEGARSRLAASYSLRALADAEGLVAEEDEVSRRVEELRDMRRARGAEDEPDPEEAAEFMKNRILELKAVDRLVEILGGAQPDEETTRGEESET